MLTHLDAAIDALSALDLDDLSDPQLHHLVVGLEQRCSRRAAARARVTQRWDARGVWSDDGSKSAAARLARDTGLSRAHAHAVLRRARRLATMPLVAAALTDGTRSGDVVDLLTRRGRWRSSPTGWRTRRHLSRETASIDGEAVPAHSRHGLRRAGWTTKQLADALLVLTSFEAFDTLTSQRGNSPLAAADTLFALAGAFFSDDRDAQA
jgi:hypothetical protein